MGGKFLVLLVRVVGLEQVEAQAPVFTDQQGWKAMRD